MSGLLLVRRIEVTRLEDDCAPAIVIDLVVRGTDNVRFVLGDPQAYAFIRQMTAALFDADPPRSGVETPGARVADR